jgi:hypothetical protein
MPTHRPSPVHDREHAIGLARSEMAIKEQDNMCTLVVCVTSFMRITSGMLAFGCSSEL